MSNSIVLNPVSIGDDSADLTAEYTPTANAVYLHTEAVICR